MSKHEIGLRVRVLDPIRGVVMQVQHGRDGLLPPVNESKKVLVFEFLVTVDLSDAAPNFLGKYAHGPKDSRFIYVNSGGSAGQADTCWNRRAKISLMDITRDEIEEVIDSAAKRLEVSFEGAGRDGGPTCASVKGTKWKVVET